MSIPLEIRVYQPEDEEGVVALWDRVFPDDPPWNEPRLVIQRKLSMQGEAFFVANVDGSIAGTVLAGFDGARGWIHHLAVNPDHRRQGVATLLVRRAEERLNAIGCPKLNLQVRAGNESAIRFYESLGFEIEERVSFGKRLGEWGAD